jgi:hypothetical protein
MPPFRAKPLLHCEAAINQCRQRKALLELPCYSVLAYYLSRSLLILLQLVGADTTATFPFWLNEYRHAQGMGRKARMRYSWALRGSCRYTRDCAICLHEAAYCNLLACQTEGLDAEDVQIVERKFPLQQLLNPIHIFGFRVLLPLLYTQDSGGNPIL